MAVNLTKRLRREKLAQSQARQHLINRDYIIQKDARFKDSASGRKKRANATNLYMVRQWKMWKRFAEKMIGEDGDAEEYFRNADIQEFRQFFIWRLTTSAISSRSTIETEWHYLLMEFADQTGKDVEKRIRNGMHGLIHGQFVDEYELRVAAKEKPVMGVEDLFLVLRFLWTTTSCGYPVERQRVQLALITLIMAYTSSRPGALVESSCARGTNESLKYRDVQLIVLRNLEDQENNVLVMLVTLRYTKGNRSAQSPTAYLFHEREDHLMLCPILHMLFLAFADDAFEAETIKLPRDVYRIHIPVERNCIEVKWKESVRDIPVFRASQRTSSGIETSSSRAMGISLLEDYLLKLGQAAGFQQKLSPYCLRRGTGNAVNKITSEAERCQVMGHSEQKTFLRSYIQTLVKTDVQSAFLEAPSQTALLKAVGRMSLGRDSRAPKELTTKQKAKIKQNYELEVIKKKIYKVRGDIIAIFGSIKSSQNSELYGTFRKLQSQHSNLEKRLQSEELEEIRNHFFDNIDTAEIEAQLRFDLKPPLQNAQNSVVIEELQNHPFLERTRLAKSLFQKIEAEDLNELEARRFAAISDMATLTFKKETIKRTPSDHPTFLSDHPTFPEMRCSSPDRPQLTDEEPDIYPIVCGSTLCLFCLQNRDLAVQTRLFSFSRKDSLSRHVRDTHLKYIPPESVFKCPHPSCFDNCSGHAGFLNHAAHVHNVSHSGWTHENLEHQSCL